MKFRLSLKSFSFWFSLGKKEEAKSVLVKLRGHASVDNEINQIVSSMSHSPNGKK